MSERSRFQVTSPLPVVDAARVEARIAQARGTPVLFWPAVALILVFAGWCGWLMVTVATERAQVEDRVRWMIRAQGLAGQVRAATAGEAADWGAIGAELVAINTEIGDTDGVSEVLAEVLAPAIVAARSTPPEPARVQEALDTLVKAARGDTARLSGRLGARWSNLNILAALALVLAIVALWMFRSAHGRRQQAEAWRGAYADAFDAVDQARAAAEKAAAMKARFLANMSHEVRTPMNGVVGMASLMLDGELDDEQHARAETIHQCGEVLLRVVDDILDISKIEAGHMVIETGHFDPRLMVETVAQLIGPPAHRQGVDVYACAMADLPRLVSGDAARVQQVLGNLAHNAVKFTEQGRIVIRGRRLDDELLFEVDDSGPGIGAADQLNLFEPFAQGQAGHDISRGTGLGLAIARQLVQLMRGTIEVDSELDRGSIFRVRLPLTVVEPTPTVDRRRSVCIYESDPDGYEALAQACRRLGLTPVDDPGADVWIVELDAIEAGMHIPPGLHPVVTYRAGTEGDRNRAREWGRPVARPVQTSVLGRAIERVRAPRGASITTRPSVERMLPRDGALFRVLLAEDNPVNERVAKAMLERLGCTVVVARNGEEAVEACQRGTRFDLVLMDCEMPVLDGLAATRRIRAAEGPRRVPIVALTANAMDDDRRRCVAAGMDDYLAKPITLDALERLVRAWMPTDLFDI